MVIALTVVYTVFGSGLGRPPDCSYCLFVPAARGRGGRGSRGQ